MRCLSANSRRCFLRGLIAGGSSQDPRNERQKSGQNDGDDGANQAHDQHAKDGIPPGRYRYGCGQQNARTRARSGTVSNQLLVLRPWDGFLRADGYRSSGDIGDQRIQFRIGCEHLTDANVELVLGESALHESELASLCTFRLVPTIRVRHVRVRLRVTGRAYTTRLTGMVPSSDLRTWEFTRISIRTAGAGGERTRSTTNLTIGRG